MMRFRKAVIALLIFVLFFPNLTEAFVFKPLLPTIDKSTVDKLETIETDSDLKTELETSLPENLPDLQILSPEQIIENSKNQPQAYVASNWDQDFLSSKNNNQISSLANNLNVDLFRGAAQYTYNLDFSAGRQNISPQLSLLYNHQLENYNNYLPFGWSLQGLIYIKRDSSNGVDSLYQDNKFIFSNGTALEPYLLTDLIHGEYRLKIDDGQALRFYYRLDDSWEIIDKNGVHYYLGGNYAAKDSVGALTYKWNINLWRDRIGNNISYTYKLIEGVSYPDQINYTNWFNENGIYKIVFDYKNREQDHYSFNAGFLQNYKQQLAGIYFYSENILRRYYQLIVADDNLAFLAEIAQWNYDINGQIDPEAQRVSFEYSVDNSGAWQRKDWGEVDFSFLYPGDTQLIDANNDGFSDVLRSAAVLYNNGQTEIEQAAWRNEGGQSLAEIDWAIPGAFYNYYENGYSFFTDTKYFDINGDSYLDFIDNGKVYLAQATRPNQAPLYQYNANYQWWPHWYYLNNQPVERASLADLNGDAFQDYIFNQNSNNYLSKLGQNQNNPLANWAQLPLPLIDSVGQSTGTRLLDLNNDGLVDLLQSFYDEATGQALRRAYLNKGDGTWFLSPADEYYPPLFFNSRNSDGKIVDNKIFILDINNDGLADLVNALSGEVYLFNKKTWTKQASSYYQLPKNLSNGLFWADFRWGEANGEPGIDLWFLEEIDGHDHLIIYENKSAYKNLLTKINNEYGASINLEYSSSALEKDNSGPSRALLKKVWVDDGFGQKQLESYNYEGSAYYINDVWQRGHNGFAKITKTDFGGNQEEYYFHQGNGANNAMEAVDSSNHLGKIYWQRKLDKNNQVLEEYYFDWRPIFSGGFNFIQLKNEAVGIFADGQSKYKNTGYLYDNYANLLKVSQYKEVALDFPRREFFDYEAKDNLYINYEYATDKSGEIKTAISRLYLSDYNGELLKDQKYYYDNLKYGALALGLLTKEEYLKDDNQWISKSNFYNKYGLLIESTDFKNNKTQYKYDKYNLFLASVIDPLGFSKKYESDYFCALVLRETDANSLAFISEYDAQCRLKNFYRENEISGEKQQLQSINYEEKFPFKQTDYRYLDKSGRAQKTVSYYDGFKRKILQLVLLENGKWQALLYRYDQNGNLILKSDYFEAYNEAWYPYNPSVYTEFKYDALNRLDFFRDNHYQIFIDYALLSKSMEINGRQRVFDFDIEGKVKSVKVGNGAGFDQSFYEYDLLGRLNKYIDAAGNERNWSYDYLDNLIYNEDAHAPADNSFIYWRYTWDANANLSKKEILPAGISLNYQYDKLNRLISEDDSTSAWLDYEYLYDLGKNALGRLSGVKSPNFEKAFIYDDFANLAAENYLLNGNNYNFAYNYDYLSNPLSVLYPDHSSLNYEYNLNGQLLRSWKLSPTGERQDIIFNRQYNIWGALISESWGNGTTRNYLFNDRKNIVQESILDENNQILWDQDYEHDWDDNLETFSISSLYFADLYHYENYHDELNRLRQARFYKNANLETTANYSYDVINNLLSSPNYDFHYEKNSAAFNNPYATVAATAKNSAFKDLIFSYDQQGNVLSDGFNFYEWNGFNRLIGQDGANGKISYFYDEHGQRLSRQDSELTEIFIGPYRAKSSGEINIYYNEYQEKTDKDLNVQKIFNYYDKFSNLVLQLDDKADLLNYYIYKPFGEIYLSANSNRGSPDLFHKQSRENHLDYAQGRYYDYAAARWLSLDPAFENLPVLAPSDLNHYLSNPYLINPYAYLANSPWRYQDENGEFLETIIDLLSIGVSFYDFIVDPSFSTGLFFLYDIGATLVPFLPASKTGQIADLLVSKAVQGGARLSAELRDLSSAIGKSLKTTMQLVKTVADQLANQDWINKLSKWSVGRVGNSVTNFAMHFVKHINDLVKFNIKNIDDYFNFSVSFLDKIGVDKVMTDLGYFYRFMDRGKEVFYNPIKKLLVVVAENAEGRFISSFYEVTDAVKHSEFWSKIKDLVGLFYQFLLSIFKNLKLI